VADQTSASIDIAAKSDEVMAVIADFEHYPDWVDSMKSAEVLTWFAGKAKTVRMVLDHTRRTTGSRKPSAGSSLRAPCSRPWTARTC
jgi:hypothetical protein